jgi:broad specificity phosphatase PhoE
MAVSPEILGPTIETECRSQDPIPDALSANSAKDCFRYAPQSPYQYPFQPLQSSTTKSLSKDKVQMSHITLIRHGQANSTARDEASYDRLSPLGRQQSMWLGEYFRRQKLHHARLYTGTLQRHVETADAMDTGLEPVRDARLNELEYFTLANAMQDQHGLAVPTEREGFIAHLPQVFLAWQQGRIDGVPETFEAFETRVRDALSDIEKGEGPALVITSGGLISMAMRHVLQLDVQGMAKMALAIFNTSQHRLFPVAGSLMPVTFNAVPHLEDPDRHYAQTHL